MNNETDSIIRKAHRNQVQVLDLSGKEIETIPYQLYELKRLLSLNLSNNKISIIENSIQNMVHLKSLDLSNNEIKTLPKEIINLPNLEVLNLKGNPIYEMIGGEFSTMWRSELKSYLENNTRIVKSHTKIIKELSNNYNNNEKYNQNNNNTNTNISNIICGNKIQGTLNNHHQININNSNTNSHIRPETGVNVTRSKLLERIQGSDKININQLLKDKALSNNIRKDELKKISIINNHNNNSSIINKQILNRPQSHYKPNNNSNNTLNRQVDSNYINDTIDLEKNRIPVKKSSTKELEDEYENYEFDNFDKNDTNVIEEINKEETLKLTINNKNINNDKNNDFLKTDNENEIHSYNDISSNNQIKPKYKFFNPSRLSNQKDNNEAILKDNKEMQEQISLLKKIIEKNEDEYIRKETVLNKKIAELEENNSLLTLSLSKQSSYTREKELEKNKDLKDLDLNYNQTSNPRKATRKNWMEEASQVNNNLQNMNNNNINNNLISNKEEESQLQKEQLYNKRLKAEVDRLNEKLNDLSNNNNNSNRGNNVMSVDLSEVVIGEKIGEGGFAIISKGKWMFLDVAVKVIFDPKITDDLLEEFNNEIKMLSYLKHPNIVTIIAICTKPKLAILTEHVSRGSLFDLLHKQRYSLILYKISILIYLYIFIQ